MASLKIYKSSNDWNKAIEDIFRKLMDQKILHTVILPRRTPNGEFVYQVVHKDKESLKETVAISPIMPKNSATLVSKLTKFTPAEEKVGVVLKPCETRAIVELVKLKQINLDNIYLFTLDCNGTFDAEYFSNSDHDSKDLETKLWSSFKDGEQSDEVRNACKICDNFFPVQTTDIGINLFFNEPGTIQIQAFSDKGEELIKTLADLEDVKPEDLKSKTDELLSTRQKIKNEYLEGFKKEVAGLENLTKFFSKCINCHNCMSQCPICICRECFFESGTFDYESEQLLSWAERQGMLKMPTDILLFHLGRMNHMVTSCISCGMCSQACPVGIDVGSIFLLTGLNAQKVFEYQPGNSFDQEIPISTFREEELKDLG